MSERFAMTKVVCTDAKPTQATVLTMKAIHIALAMVSLIFSAQLFAADVPHPLIDASDAQLQLALEATIEKQGLSRAVRKQQLAVVLVALSDPQKPRFAEVNGHTMLYAASLPKIAILLGAAVAIDEGRLVLDTELQTDLDNMIRHSCNACATKVLEMVGRKELLRILQAPEFNFYDKNDNGGLWVGKDYGPNAAHKRDPLSGLSHGATAFQAARFYYKLHNGTLVNAQQSAMMLDVLSRPGISHKFVKGLAAYPDVEIFRKSGTWRSYHADSALVRSGKNTYIMVALANDPNAAHWLEQLAAPLHKLAISINAE